MKPSDTIEAGFVFQADKAISGPRAPATADGTLSSSLRADRYEGACYHSCSVCCILCAINLCGTYRPHISLIAERFSLRNMVSSIRNMKLLTIGSEEL